MTLHVCKHSNLLCSVIFVNFYNFSTMTSLRCHWSVVSTGNCKLGHDCRRVCSHRRHDATRQFRRVGGVYWTLVSSVLDAVLKRYYNYHETRTRNQQVCKVQTCNKQLATNPITFTIKLATLQGNGRYYVLDAVQSGGAFSQQASGSLRNQSSDSLHVWFQGTIFDVGGFGLAKYTNNNNNNNNNYYYYYYKCSNTTGVATRKTQLVASVLAVVGLL